MVIAGLLLVIFRLLMRWVGGVVAGGSEEDGWVGVGVRGEEVSCAVMSEGGFEWILYTCVFY